MDEEKNSFVFYRSFYEALKKLNSTNRLRLYDAICELALNDNDANFDALDVKFDAKLDANFDVDNAKLDAKNDAICDVVFNLIKPQILANNKRYRDGIKGGRPKKTTGFENEKPNVNENVNVNDNDIYEHFNLMWDRYPVKKGKQKAETYYRQWLKGRKINNKVLKLTEKDMWYALQMFLVETSKNKTDIQFIPHGSTFFNSKIYDYYELWKENNNE